MVARSSNEEPAAPDFATARLSVTHSRSRLAGAGRRAFESQFADLLVPEVLKHLPGPFDPGASGIAPVIADLDRAADVYLVEALGTQTLAGLLILSPDPDARGHLHLGYLLGRQFWGQGLAGELLSGLIASLSPTGVTELYAGVEPENRVSVRLLERAGFRRDEDQRSGEGALIYRLTVPKGQ